MQPLSGHSSDATDCGQAIAHHREPLQTTYGTTYLVADSALYSADNLEQLQDTHAKWITRVPATLNEAHGARWLRIYSEPRRLQVQRPGTTHWRQHSKQETTAFTKLCRSAFACQAEARLALSTFEHGLKYTTLHEVTSRPTPRYDKPERPKRSDVPPDMSDHIAGALASPLAAHEALVVQESGFILATNELNEALRPPLKFFEGYQGQQHAERGSRFLKDIQSFTQGFLEQGIEVTASGHLNPYSLDAEPVEMLHPGLHLPTTEGTTISRYSILTLYSCNSRPLLCLIPDCAEAEVRSSGRELACRVADAYVPYALHKLRPLLRQHYQELPQ